MKENIFELTIKPFIKFTIKYLLKIFILLLILSGCNNKKVNNLLMSKDTHIVDLDNAAKSDTLFLSTLFKSVKCIPLETTDNILIGGIDKVLVYKNVIYVLDVSHAKALFAFDEKGNFVISLLSGHMGGANEFAKKIAKLLSFSEVISTATDVNGKIGIDVLANHFYWNIVNKNNVLFFNKAILKEEIIHLKSNSRTIQYIEDYFLDNTLEILDYKKQDTSIKDNEDITINSDNIIVHNGKLMMNYDIPMGNKDKLIDDNKNNLDNDFKYDKIKKDFNYLLKSDETYKNKIIANLKNKKLELKPRKLVIGIGARKNIGEDDVLLGIEKAMKNLAISFHRIDCIATVSFKKNESGIKKAAETLNKPFIIVEKEKIQDFYNSPNSKDCTKSSFVKENFRIDGVCESCAMIVSGEGSKLIHKKIAINGVTIAVAVSKQI